MLVSKDYFAKFSEKPALQGFRKKIGQHLFRWAMLYVDGFEADTIFDEEVSDVDVSRVGATRFASVLLETDGALVVLVENVFLQTYP
jgi:hypothetical protein